jgi:hypothetical protein
MPISKSERERRYRLLQVHTEAENDHDIDAIMATFAPTAELVFNGLRFTDLASIREAHIGFGMSALPAPLVGVRQVIERVSYGDQHIIVEARLFARHEQTFNGYPPSHQELELYNVAAYLFDDTDKLVSERVVMNWGPITLPYALSQANSRSISP